MKPKLDGRALDDYSEVIGSLHERSLRRLILAIVLASPSLRHRVLSIALLLFLFGALLGFVVMYTSIKVHVDNLWVFITVAIILALVALVLYFLKRHAYPPAEQTAQYPGRPLFTSDDIKGPQAQTAAHLVARGRGYESISFTIELPNKLLIRDFAEVIQDVTTALEKVGYILYLINSGEIPKRFFMGEDQRAPRHFVFELDIGAILLSVSPSPPRPN
jgi:hypothetical protein